VYSLGGSPRKQACLSFLAAEMSDKLQEASVSPQEPTMLGRLSIKMLLATSLLIAPVTLLSQSAGEKRTLILNGQSTDVPLIRVDGHPYVGLEALADALKGSLSSAGEMVALSVPVGSPDAATTTSKPASSSAKATQASAPADAANPGFSKGFLNAGIEQMSTMREWHTALATAIQNGIPLTAELLAPYRAQAATNLRLASVAASTPSDHNAYDLLNNEFQNMGKLSDKYLSMRAGMTYISPDALKSDALDQQIIACGHALGAMAASGQFSDDGTCH
jgi:hypothetical protein